jgi:hypothetical protein
MSLRAGLVYESLRRPGGDIDPSVRVLVDIRCERRGHQIAHVYATASGPLLAGTSGRLPVSLPPVAELVDEETGDVRLPGPLSPILLDEDPDEDGWRGHGAAPGEVAFVCRCGAPTIDREVVVRAARQAPPTVRLNVPNRTTHA